MSECPKEAVWALLDQVETELNRMNAMAKGEHASHVIQIRNLISRPNCICKEVNCNEARRHPLCSD